MSAIPWFSTFTLGTEILVTVSVLYVLRHAYKTGTFPYKLTAITLGYEILFNISYMASRAIGGQNPSRLSGKAVLGLAIFHGSFSLLMFIALIVFMVLAWKNYKQGVNYFLVHKTLTVIFAALWLVAIASGITFYYLAYLA